MKKMEKDMELMFEERFAKLEKELKMKNDKLIELE